jgi:alkylated DNA repair protein (DNA oxidative demethylase)
MTGALFAIADPPASGSETLGLGAFLLHGFAAGDAPALWMALQPILAQAPLRRMITPSGHRMSVAMTNCGALGWVSDRAGYRYAPCDPESGRPWPPMPLLFRQRAQAAATQAGFPAFQPDVCLINCYAPGTRLSLHQDRDERDLRAPIVSVSLGLPVVFLWGGLKRQEPVRRIRLEHGDVVVWGGPDRLRYHGVLPLKASQHPLLGEQRLNLTFRHAA